MNQKLFSKDFTLVVVGQIISLFGNAAVRFALPLYLLNLTGSSALYGTVTACAFIPAILLSPVGNIGFLYCGGNPDIFPAYGRGKYHFASDGYVNAFIRHCGRISAVRTGKYSCAYQPRTFYSG